MGDPGRAFASVGEFLSELGFEIVHESDVEGFGSRFVDFRRDDLQIRVIWDGRDEWLIAQELLPWSPEPGSRAARDIAVQRVGRRAADELDLLAFQQGIRDWLYPTGSPGV